MQKKKSIALLTSVILGISTVAFAAFTPREWHYTRPISNLPTQQSMVTFSFPQDMHWTGNGFADLRIIDTQGNETPYFLTRSISSGPVVPVSILNLSSTSDGSTEFIIDTGQSGSVFTGLHINTNSPNFRRQVKIYASESLIPMHDERWSLVTNDGFMFKFSDPRLSFVSGKDDVTFPRNASRYFKVVIGSGPEGAVSVSDATIYRDTKISTEQYSREVNAVIYNNADKKTTEVTIDLGAEGIINNSATLWASDSNYNRRVVVDVSNTNSATSSWTYVGQGSISRVSTSVFQGASSQITYSEQRSRYMRFSIVNDDNPPLSLTPSVTLLSPVISVIFEARTGSSYTLYYGNPNAQQPQYDIASLSSYIEEGTLPIVNVGLESVNPLYVTPAGPVIPFTESHKILLNILLVLVVLGIAVAIFFYLRSYVRKANIS
ncbi:MAG: DUF3999 family protein [Candidatus Taylorbacteria bacterium]